MWKELAAMPSVADRLARFEKFLRGVIRHGPLRQKLRALFVEGQKSWVSQSVTVTP